MRYHNTAISKAEVQYADNTKCWWRTGSNRNSHSVLMRVQNSTTPLEDSLVIFYKTKHTLTIRFSNHIPWYLPNRAKNLCPHKKLHKINILFIYLFIYFYYSMTFITFIVVIQKGIRKCCVGLISFFSLSLFFYYAMDVLFILTNTWK